MDGGKVAAFMEITSCGSQTTAVRHLASCGWRIEAAIDLYFTAGAGDQVRDPIPAQSEALYDDKFAAGAGDDPVRAPIPTRSETLYGDPYAASSSDPYAASSSAASSVWGVKREEAPSLKSSSVPAVPVQVLSVPELKATGWEDDGDNGGKREEEEIKGSDEEEEKDGADAVEDDAYNGTGKEEEKDGVDADQEDDADVGKEKGEDDGYDDTGMEEENSYCSMEEDYGEKEEEKDGVDGDHEDDADVGKEKDEDDGYDDTGMEEEDSYYGMEEDYGENVQSDDDLTDPGDFDSEDGMEAEFDDVQSSPQRRSEKSLKDLFRPPYELMYGGSFHDAKVHAARQDQWLLMNLQSSGVFASHTHNRDLWSNEVVAQVVRSNFVFQLLEKNSADDGSKVCCFYKLGDDQLPAVLVLDPITGQLLSKWSGSLQPDDFLTSIGKYTESKPSTLSKPKIVPRTTATPESNQSAPEQEPATPAETAAPIDAQESAAPEPKLVEKIETPATTADYYEQPIEEGEKICKMRVRLPSGDVAIKEFGSKRSVAVLFAYCRSVVQTEQAFRITRMAGGAFEELPGDDASFEDLGLSYCTVSVVLNV